MSDCHCGADHMGRDEHDGCCPKASPVPGPGVTVADLAKVEQLGLGLAVAVKPRHGVTQTILASDPKREGNCLAACVATFLDIELQRVPHFLEFGIAWNGEDDRTAWLAMLSGFMAGRGRWIVDLDTLADADEGEVVFIAGPSPRGVMHQVLYRDGVLWHDPHPSGDGVLEVHRVEAWRPLPPAGFDHSPTAHEGA